MGNVENLIPVMTSNTEPYGIAFATQCFSNEDNYQAYKLFDKIVDSGHAYINNGTMPTFFGYEFIRPVVVNKISIVGRINSLPEQSLKDFQIQAYNENENKWDILKDVVNEPSWKNGEKREYSFDNNKSYKKYRVYCTSAHSMNNYLTITEMEMFGYVYDKFLLKQNNQYYTIKSQFYDGKMYKPCTKDFPTNGFEDLNGLIQSVENVERIGTKDVINEVDVFRFNVGNYVNKIEVM